MEPVEESSMARCLHGSEVVPHQRGRASEQFVGRNCSRRVLYLAGEELERTWRNMIDGRPPMRLRMEVLYWRLQAINIRSKVGIVEGLAVENLDGGKSSRRRR